MSSRSTKTRLRIVLIAAAFSLVAIATASAQQFSNVPDHSVIGRIGIGGQSGPSQAIPFSSFLPTIVGGQSANTVFAGPSSGNAAAPSFRSLAGADLPNPGASSLGGVQSLTCSTNSWFNTLSTTGTLGCSQPSFSALTGSIAISQFNGGSGASSTTCWWGNGVWAACGQVAAFTPTNASPSAQTIQAQLQKIPVSCEDYSGGCTAANIAQAMTDAATNGRCFQFNGNYTVTASVVLNALPGVLCLNGRGGLVAGGTLNGPMLDIKDSNSGVYIESGLAWNCSSILSVPAAVRFYADNAGGMSAVHVYDPVIANCRRGFQFGDPNYTDFLVDGNVIEGGYTFNVAQPVAVYSSQAGLFVHNMQNHADNSSLSTSFTGTCSGTTLAASAVTGFLAKDNRPSGTGITAGTYIVGQTSGSTGGAGNYTVSQACTSSSNALTAKPLAVNYIAVGATLNVRNGWVQNSTVDGRHFLSRPVNSATYTYPYGRISVVGSTMEGSDVMFTTDTDGVGTPGSGAFYLNGVQGDYSANTNCYITTDTAWTGTISVQANRLFATGARTQKNICANNTGAVINFDLESFGANMLQGYAGVSGGTQRLTTKDLAQGVAVTTTSSQNPGDSIITFAGSGTITYTMLSASNYPGRMLYLNNTAAQAVNSASSNILNQSGSAVSSIFPAAAGKWMILVSDQSLGNFWRIVANN